MRISSVPSRFLSLCQMSLSRSVLSGVLPVLLLFISLPVAAQETYTNQPDIKTSAIPSVLDVEVRGMQQGDFVENDRYRITLATDVFTNEYGRKSVELVISDFSDGTESFVVLALMEYHQAYIEEILFAADGRALVVSEFGGNEIFILDLARKEVIDKVWAHIQQSYALSPDRHLLAYVHLLPAYGVSVDAMRHIWFLYDVSATPEENNPLQQEGDAGNVSGLPLFPFANRQEMSYSIWAEDTAYKIMSPIIWHPTRPLLAFMAMTHEELEAKGRFQEVMLVTLYCDNLDKPLDPGSWHSKVATFEPHSLMEPKQFEYVVKHNFFGGIAFDALAWEGDDALTGVFYWQHSNLLGYDQITVSLP